MSYERWDRPWSDRAEYPVEDKQPRIIREARLSDFSWGAVFLIIAALFALAAIADGVQICLDVFRLGKSSRATDHQVLWAMAAILLGPPAIALCFWLMRCVMRGAGRALTAKPDAIYLRRRW